MKVIDLLNMVANGEIDEDIKYQFSNCDYCTIREFFNRYIVDEANLNLEIIEDTPKEDKKIEKLNIGIIVDDELQGLIKSINVCNKDIQDKLNKIIDRLNGDSDE